MLDDAAIGSLLSAPPLDVLALAWFFLLWGGYNLTVDWLLRRPLGLNQHMGLVRNAWMAAMVKRDDRVIDAILIGHLIHSVTFFASTTMLLVAALVGILAALTKPSMLSWGAWARRRPARRHNYIAAATR